MWLSDVSVKRPVLAAVLSLLLVAFGLLSFRELPLREYPNINPPIVSVSTEYVGASAAVVESRVTEVIESQISGVEGIESISSSSRDGRSNIVIEFSLDRDIDQAANDIRDRVSRILDNLPEDIDPPEVAKQDSDARPVMWISVSSDQMGVMALSDYADRYLVDRFSVIPGVAQASLNSSGRPSMRIWLDRNAIAARRLTVNDIEAALRRENLELPAGRIESPTREFQVRMARNYRTPDDFRQLVIGRGDDDHLIRLGELARVELAPSELRSLFRANTKNMVGIGIVQQSTANTLEMLEAVKAEMRRINASIPSHIQLIPSSDDSLYIREAVNSVYQTLAITTALVSLVILIFLGSLRAMIIPAVTIPVCLIAAFTVLAAFGFTVNLITLLALVLSIGLVVDDAIVVLENIHRRIEEGEPPLLAAYRGARQVAFAVIATTVVLVAVFVPITFLDDNVGRIFSELAVTICAAVSFSTVLALSLTPMLSSKWLKRSDGRPARWERFTDRLFDRLAGRYERALTATLKVPWLVALLALTAFAAIYFVGREVPREYAPSEDQGLFFAMVQAPEGTGFEHMLSQMKQLEAPLLPLVEDGTVSRVLTRVPAFGSNQTSTGFLVVSMAPWQQRELTTTDVIGQVSGSWQQVPDVQAFAFMRSGLSRGGGGQPVQFVLGGSNYDELADWRDRILERARKNPGLIRLDSDLKETQPQVIVNVDKDRAAVLGVSVQNVGRTLQTLMSEQRVTTFLDDGEEYDVILQARPEQRATPDDLNNIYVRSDTTSELIALANLVTVDSRGGAGVLNRYNRLRAVTISASLAPGYSLGDALDFLQRAAREELPASAQIDFKGESLEYQESTADMVFIFTIALLIVFLVLAAQFESFVQPLVIMVTVPLAVAGALAGLLVFGKTLNIYSQIGILMLVGIASKNGILIVEFINQQRSAGREFLDAIVSASRLRLRPVLMTAVSTISGSIPLVLATGAGSESRTVLGIVIFTGVAVATLLTLFVVPSFYALLARGTTDPEAVARTLESMEQQESHGG